MNDASDAELRAVFGPRADYYVAEWHGTARGVTNWAAFFLSALWLPFRRMYAIALAFYAAVTVETVVEDLVFRGLGYDSVPELVEPGAGLAFALACGIWGNRWYFSRVSRLIARTRQRALGPEEHLKALHELGGTRALHAIGFLIIYIAVSTAAVIGMDLVLGE